MKTKMTIRPNNSRAGQFCSSNNKGAALLIIMVALFMVTILAVGVLSVISSALYTNHLQQSRAAALNIAESGAEMGAIWMRGQAYPPTTTIQPSIPAWAGTGSYNVTIIPDPDNATVFLKTFTIKSVGTCGSMKKTVNVVLKQATFGKYAYFTNKETSSSGSAIWWNSKDLIDGPVHSNNSSGTNFQIDYSGWSSNTPTRPIFKDMVTGCGSSITYTPRSPRSESEYQKVFLNGSTGFRLGVPRIDLPPTSNAQKEAAWGGNTGFPSTTGVYLRAGSNGGVYIQGDAGIVMTVNASGNQVMTVTQGTSPSIKTTVITYNKTTGQITATGTLPTGTVSPVTSLSNGVIYCQGNITALSGTIADNKVNGTAVQTRSAYTIATDLAGGKDITITGDLVYKTRPDKTKPSTATANLLAGTLGLVARNIKIADSGAPNYDHPNREINASMLAGGYNLDGSISVNNYALGSAGTLKVIGGLIQSTRGIVASLSSGIVNHGYAKNYSYDVRLAVDPPPFYPTTGQYDRLSWQVVPNG